MEVINMGMVETNMGVPGLIKLFDHSMVNIHTLIQSCIEDMKPVIERSVKEKEECYENGYLQEKDLYIKHTLESITMFAEKCTINTIDECKNGGLTNWQIENNYMVDKYAWFDIFLRHVKTLKQTPNGITFDEKLFLRELIEKIGLYIYKVDGGMLDISNRHLYISNPYHEISFSFYVGESFLSTLHEGNNIHVGKIIAGMAADRYKWKGFTKRIKGLEYLDSKMPVWYYNFTMGMYEDIMQLIMSSILSESEDSEKIQVRIQLD